MQKKHDEYGIELEELYTSGIITWEELHKRSMDFLDNSLYKFALRKEFKIDRLLDAYGITYKDLERDYEDLREA